MTHRIFFNEVVARDGFQNEPAFVPTEAKVDLIDRLSGCGFAKIEVTSFMSAKAIPMLRDAEQVMNQITRRPSVEYTVLVPNARGAERALECPVDELNVVMSLSESHNRANLGMGREQSFQAIQQVALLAEQKSVPLNVSLSTAFGCPIEGYIALESVVEWARRLADIGVRGLTMCDTTGMANPAQAAQMSDAMQHLFGHLQLTLHFHDTRGMGLANVLAGAQQGISRFDGSLGGLGGCPYAPGATGNICTEDAVHMLDAVGFATGVDLDMLCAIARSLPTLVGHDVPGRIIVAGTSGNTNRIPRGAGRACSNTAGLENQKN